MRAFSSRTHPIAFSCIRTPCIHICILNSLHSVRGPFNCNSTAFLLCCIRYKLHLSQCTFLYIQLHYIKLHSVAFCLCTTYNVIQHTFILAAFTHSTFTYIHVHLRSECVWISAAAEVLYVSECWGVCALCECVTLVVCDERSMQKECKRMHLTKNADNPVCQWIRSPHNAFALYTYK